MRVPDSGKSYFAAQKIIFRLLTETDHKFLVLRKVASTLKNSVFALFKDVLSDLGLSDEFQINKSDFSMICIRNGNQLIFSGLDDSEKVKSINGITGMFLEEASEFSLQDWNQLQLRIRGIKKNYVQFILCFNPISEDSWLKKDLWDIVDDDKYQIRTTYLDNTYLSKKDIEHFENRLKKNPNFWRIYGLGLFGTLQTGQEMVYSFNYKKHCDNVIYDESLPLHISLDFNVLPFCSMGIFQIINKKIIMIDEIALEHPFNKTVDVCREFLKRYYNHKSGLFVCADPSGKHSDTRTEAGYNDFSIIRKELNMFKPQFRVGVKAPSVVMSTNFLNSILSDDIEGMNIKIDYNCKNLIKDLMYLKQDSSGGKLIEYEKHPETGTKMEKFGHFYDLFRYFIIQTFPSEYVKYQTGGGKPYLNKIRNRNKNSY